MGVEVVWVLLFGLAAFEVGLFIWLFFATDWHTKRLNDFVQNLMRGFRDAPDFSSRATPAEQLTDAINFLLERAEASVADKDEISGFARELDKRSSVLRFQRIEMANELAGQIVQAFPILGIAGTLLALRPVRSDGWVDPTTISTGFVDAIDTTLAGIALAVAGMLMHSVLSVRAERAVSNSQKIHQLIHRNFRRS